MKTYRYATVALAMVLGGCAFDAGQDEAQQEHDGAEVSEAKEQLGGNAWALSWPERYGVVKISATRQGTGAVRRTWYTSSTSQGAYITTAAHLFSPIDYLVPSSVKLQMGPYSASAASIVRHPTLDIAIVRVNRTFPVNGAWTWTRGLYTGSYSNLAGSTIQCFGYGETAAGANNYGTFRYARFNVSSYFPSPYDLLEVGYQTYGAAIYEGDSGGPCTLSGYQVGTISKSYLNQTPPVGTLIAMDLNVRNWIAGNTR